MTAVTAVTCTTTRTFSRSAPGRSARHFSTRLLTTPDPTRTTTYAHTGSCATRPTWRNTSSTPSASGPTAYATTAGESVGGDAPCALERPSSICPHRPLDQVA